MGCASWPDVKAYEVCPACEQPTTRYSNLEPIGLVEAQSILNELQFEDYYEQYCIRNSIPYTDGPLPDSFAADHVLGDLRYEALPS